MEQLGQTLFLSHSNLAPPSESLPVQHIPPMETEPWRKPAATFAEIQRQAGSLFTEEEGVGVRYPVGGCHMQKVGTGYLEAWRHKGRFGKYTGFLVGPWWEEGTKIRGAGAQCPGSDCLGLGLPRGGSVCCRQPGCCPPVCPVPQG